MQTAHRDIVSRMQENFEQKMEGLRNNVDSAHGEQVQELQSLLEDRHKMVSGLYCYENVPAPNRSHFWISSTE